MSPSSDVVLAYLHPAEVGHNFCQSLLESTIFDFGHDQRVGSYLAMRTSSVGIVEGRNEVVRQFLDGPGEWLWWVDADMGFAPDALYGLLSVADVESAPVVGGLCFAWREATVDGLQGYRCEARPTIFDYVDLGAGRKFTARSGYEPDTVTRCDATGSAMILIHRSALQAVRDEFGDLWYERIQTQDGKVGEDISFCARLGALGIPVHINTAVRTNHLKHVWVSDVDFAADDDEGDPVTYTLEVMRR